MIRQRAIWIALVGLVLVAGALSGPAGRAQPERKPARVMLLGVWDRVMPLIERASTESDVPYVALSGADLADSDGESLDGIQVVYVLNFEAHQATRLQELFEQAKRDNPQLKIIPLSHRDTHVPLESAGVFDSDPEVQSYWSGNGGVNLRRLFQYTAVTYLGAEGEVKPPLIIPDAGFYHPTLSGPLQDIKEYRKAVGWKVGSPVAVLLMQHSFWISEDTRVIDAETRALEDHGFNVAVIFGGA